MRRGIRNLSRDAPHERAVSDIQSQARKQFALLREDQRHTSLQFKKVGISRGLEIWYARVTRKYRVPAIRREHTWIWSWIGEHNVYDAQVG